MGYGVCRNCKQCSDTNHNVQPILTNWNDNFKIITFSTILENSISKFLPWQNVLSKLSEQCYLI